MLPVVRPHRDPERHLPAAPQGLETAWQRCFLEGRLAQIGFVFAVLPAVLALYPAAAISSLPMLLALLCGALAGVLAVRSRVPADALAWSATSLAPLGLAPWLGGASLPLAAMAVFALLLEWCAAPARVRAAGWLTALFALSGLVTLAIAALSGQGQMHGIGIAAGLAMLAAPIVTLLRVNAAGQALLSGALVQADSNIRREAQLVAALDLAALIVNRSAEVREATAAAVTLLGETRDDLIGRGLIDRVLIADRPALLKAVSDASTDARHSRLTVRLALAGADAGSAPRYVESEVQVRPLDASGGEAVVCLDVPQSGACARMRAVPRSDLFGTLSHDLRTPMNAILGFSEMLSQPGLQPRDPGEVSNYAGIIHRSARDLFAVTQAMVDLLRVESSDFEPKPEILDLAGLADKVAASAGGPGPCRCEIPTDCPTVVADPRLMRMLLTNLVDGFMQAGARDAGCLVRLIPAPGNVEVAVIAAVDPARPARAAHLGVVGALAHRIAELTGSTLALTTEGAQLSARFSLSTAARVMPIPVRTAARAAHFQPSPQRKSA